MRLVKAGKRKEIDRDGTVTHGARSDDAVICRLLTCRVNACVEKRGQVKTFLLKLVFCTSRDEFCETKHK